MSRHPPVRPRPPVSVSAGENGCRCRSQRDRGGSSAPRRRSASRHRDRARRRSCCSRRRRTCWRGAPRSMPRPALAPAPGRLDAAQHGAVHVAVQYEVGADPGDRLAHRALVAQLLVPAGAADLRRMVDQHHPAQVPQVAHHRLEACELSGADLARGDQRRARQRRAQPDEGHAAAPAQQREIVARGRRRGTVARHIGAPQTLRRRPRTGT